MNRDALLALFALLPVALGPLPAQARSITAFICSGDGISRSIEIPIDDQAPFPPPCSAKGCHAGSCRKRFDLSQ
ncbi:hypothetical protein [Erythrobacter mangrovi]|uniref:DUF2946 family protein n=1 Tax=Erythrobacter mangrovi TaxID=2739433 RepID=A0A7D4BWU3_9SPHN|nr:hypothetical protein [Erythrobacter mangrovi]QKG72127.1 hypothetical protein HQR01_12545 [Erythrobacter mangrovi]